MSIVLLKFFRAKFINHIRFRLSEEMNVSFISYNFISDTKYIYFSMWYFCTKLD